MPDRNYADEWLPSRFSLGTLRLMAYLISRSLERTRPTSGAYLNREPGQHPLEANILSIAYWIIPAAQFALLAAAMTGWGWWLTPFAFVLLLAIVPNAWVLVALLFSPLATRLSALIGRSTHDIQARITPTGMLVLAVVSVVRQWPGAPLGWIWLVLTAVELAALSVCALLRNQFDELDRRLPAETP